MTSSSQEQRERFEGEVLRHLSVLYRFAFYLSGNAADAEDLTQDTLHLAFRGFDGFRQGTDAKAWLLQIARNRHTDLLRRKAREPVLAEVAELDRKAGLDRSDGSGSPIGAALRGAGGKGSSSKRSIFEAEEVFYDLFGDEVNRYLAELPGEFRHALVLCDVEGWSYREIGDVLGCPVGTVRSRISRAREQLRGKLYEYAKSLGFVPQGAE